MRRSKAQRNQDCIEWEHCPNPLLPFQFVKTLLFVRVIYAFFNFPAPRYSMLQKRGWKEEKEEPRSVDFLWSPTDSLVCLTWRVRLHVWSMPCIRVGAQWEIRPTFTLRRIRRAKSLMWQRMRRLARACRHGVGYTVNYNDPDREEQEIVCLEVWTQYKHSFIPNHTLL